MKWFPMLPCSALGVKAIYPQMTVTIALRVIAGGIRRHHEYIW
jgi:hypothetical protein